LARQSDGDKEMTMKLRRFSGNDLRDCMRQVREALGPDAVILETVRAATGFEIAAAVDAGLPAASRPAAVEVAMADDLDYLDAGPAVVIGEAAGSSTATPLRTVAPSSGDYDRLREELGSLRTLLEQQLGRLLWDDRARRSPATAAALRRFGQLGLDADVADQLATTAARTDDGGSWTAVLRTLVRALPVAAEDCTVRGGVYAVVGPTGVGKTTTIAKLAARAALQSGADRIGLVTTDTFRVAAREQLETYGQILGITVHQVSDGQALAEAVAALRDRHLILIDTAGIGQRDPRLTGELTRLAAAPLPADRPVQALLALPANGDARTLREIVDVFRTIRPAACILTKTDEAASLGGAFSALIRSGLPLAYVANGQRVPEDLHFMHDREAWLTKMAVELMRREAPVITADDLASRHAEAEIHAYA
jgi:flagellar biosynthesis protein FlhF